MDERKSWNRLIFAYSGVGIVVLVAAFFIARSAGHNNFIAAHAATTPPPSEVGVYSGIAPDATAIPAPAVSPTTTPSASASPSSSPTAQPSPLAHASAVAMLPHKHTAKHARKLLADTGSSSDGAPPDGGESTRVAPVIHSSDRPGADQVPEATAAPASVTAAPVIETTQTPAATAAPAAPAAPAANVPIFAPERIVDAQVKVAVQPDMSAADRERGAHGTSVILVTIDPKGSVISAVVGSSSGFSTLDRAAVTAARSSQFVAPKINGRPATETYRVVYDFDQ